jgi:hypothetical protein
VSWPPCLRNDIGERDANIYAGPPACRHTNIFVKIAPQGQGHRAYWGAVSSTLDDLDKQMGYSVGWEEVLDATAEATLKSNLDGPEMDRIRRGALRLNRTPIWDRSETELEHWFELPFFDRAGTHKRGMVLTLDARACDGPSSIAEWDEDDDYGDVVEFAKLPDCQ